MPGNFDNTPKTAEMPVYVPPVRPTRPTAFFAYFIVGVPLDDQKLFMKGFDDGFTHIKSIYTEDSNHSTYRKWFGVGITPSDLTMMPTAFIRNYRRLMGEPGKDPEQNGTFSVRIVNLETDQSYLYDEAEDGYL